MNITDIKENDHIKLSMTSITVKDENGKTKGIVTNCRIPKTDPRISFSIFSKLQKDLKGTGFHTTSVMSEIVINNNEMYYLHDVLLEKMVSEYLNKYKGNKNVLDALKKDIALIESKKQLLAALESGGIKVIRCLFI